MYSVAILPLFAVSENVEMLSKLAPRLLAVTARGKHYPAVFDICMGLFCASLIIHKT